MSCSISLDLRHRFALIGFIYELPWTKVFFFHAIGLSLTEMDFLTLSWNIQREVVSQNFNSSTEAADKKASSASSRHVCWPSVKIASTIFIRYLPKRKYSWLHSEITDTSFEFPSISVNAVVFKY